MTTSVTKRLLLAVLVLSVVATIGVSGCKSGGANDTIKIGGTFNLTGNMASLDVPASNGALLAVKEINAAGGVLGKKIDFILLDGKTDPATVGNTATQLVNEKVVAIVGNTDSDSALAVGPIAQAAGIPYITAGATSPNLPAQVGDMMFLEPFGDNVQAAAGVEFAVNQLHAKTAYLLYDKGTEYTKLLAKYWKDAFTKANGPNSILLEDTFQNRDTDFSAQITRLKALKQQPDVMLIAVLEATDGGTIAKQFRDAGINLPIIGGDGWDGPQLIEVGGANTHDVYFTTHAFMSETEGTDKVKKFWAAYKAEYNKDPESAFAPLGYDAVYLLVDAIKRAGSTDGKAIRDALEKTRGFEGVTGSITYQPGSHIPQKAVTIIAVKDQKYTLGATVVPQYIPAP